MSLKPDNTLRNSQSQDFDNTPVEIKRFIEKLGKAAGKCASKEGIQLKSASFMVTAAPDSDFDAVTMCISYEPVGTKH